MVSLANPSFLYKNKRIRKDMSGSGKQEMGFIHSLDAVCDRGYGGC